MPVSEEEDIARAICSDKWDPKTGLVSASLFKGEEVSVSRLAITPLEETWALFRSSVEKPPERTLKRIGTINVGTLAEVGAKYENEPVKLTVEPNPLDGYPSHAIIPQKITRGLSNQILKKLTIHEEEG